MACWCIPISPALGRLRQENCKFKASLDYTEKPCLRKTKNQTETNTNKQKKPKHFREKVFITLRFT
jgi:hypothetical protein